MILTTHALAGAVIGKLIPNPWIVIPASLVIHFSMDHLRHGEYVEIFQNREAVKKTWWKVALDLLFAFVIPLAFVYFGNFDYIQTRNIMLGVLFSTLPDAITFLYWKFDFKFLAPYYQFHSWVHRYPRASQEREWTFRNAWNDTLISLICILLLFL